MIDNVQYDVNEVNFISTQMQGRYEESLQDDAQRLRATQIQRFKLIDASLTESEVKINKKIVPTRKLVKLVKRKKIASMTSLMKEKYSDTAEKDTMSQLSILLFLSGKKHKVADILKKIELAEINSSEQREDFEDVEEGKMGEDCDENGTRFVYSKTEWNKILRNIKLQFPRLSIETKKSLQHMTKRIQIQQEMMESEGIGSIWTQSSATPSQSEYSIEDMKWLYNLTDEQVDYVKASNNGTISSEGGYFSDINEDQQLFVMTLSQVMNGKTKQIDTSSDEEEERDIGDKEIIPETIREEDGEILIGLPQEEVGIKTEELPRTPKLSREIDNADDDDEVIPNSSPDLSPIYVVTSSPQISPPKLEILETMYEKVDPISSHQREDIFSLDTLSFPIKEKESIITINSDIDDAEEVFSSSLPAQQKGESEVIYAEEIISSPVQSAETKEVEFKTPTKPRTKEVSKYPLDLLLDSPIKATMQTNSNKRALYNTSIVEIRGGMEINEQFDNVNENNIKVRKIGSRILPQ